MFGQIKLEIYQILACILPDAAWCPSDSGQALLDSAWVPDSDQVQADSAWGLDSDQVQSGSA